jgi:hypothetical protein
MHQNNNNNMDNVQKQHKNQIKLGNSVTENAKFIKWLAQTKSSSRRTQIIQGASTDQLLALVETALNVINAKQPFWSRRQRDKLCVHAQLIRKLARTRTPKSARRILIRGEKDQKGGGVPVIALAGILSNVLLPYLSEHLLMGDKNA